MKKNVIFVTKALWVGGIETALVNLLRSFDYERYHVTLLVLKAELNLLPQVDPRCTVLITDRDETHSFSKPYRFSRLFHLTETPSAPSLRHRLLGWTIPMLRWVENRLYVRYVRNCMRGRSYETAVIYSDVAGETAIRAVEADAFVLFYHHGVMRHVYHDRIAWRRSKAVAAVSANQAELLRTFEPTYARKLRVVPNLVDPARVRERAGEPLNASFEAECFHIVSVGRLVWEKGLDLAVETCASLVHAGYRNLRWWIVGDGPDREGVREAVSEQGMEKHVFLVGMQENPYPWIRRADLFVQPSRFESYGMTILEALILGKPVVATATPGAREIFSELDPAPGLLCPITAEDLAAGIRRLLDDPEGLAALRREAEALDFSAHNAAALAALEALL